MDNLLMPVIILRADEVDENDFVIIEVITEDEDLRRGMLCLQTEITSVFFNY